MKLKHGLYILLVIFSLVPLLIFGIFMIRENDRKIEEIVRDNLEAISGAQILDIQNFCEGRRENTEMLARYEIIRDALRDSLNGETDGKSKEYLEDMLWERKEYVDFLASISVVDSNFRVVASSEEYNNEEISELSSADSSGYLNGNFRIANVFDRKKEDGTVIRVLPVLQGVWEDDQLLGYLVEEIAVTYFDQLRSETNLWEEGTFYLLDGNNVPITAGSPGEENRDEYITSEEERRSYTEAWNSIDHEKYPSGSIDYEVGGVKYITYYSNVEYTDWSVRVTVNLSTYTENTKAYRMMTVFLLAIIVFFLAILNVFFARYLTKPLNEMADTLQQIQTNQDYTLRLESHSKNELGFFAENVNKLLNYIEQENIQEKEQQRYLARKAEHDPLTGIRNKVAIEDTIQEMFRQSVENKTPLAIGFLDIDDFRDYNTKYGHQVGDRIIQFTASALKETINGKVGRNGGDEFVFAIPEARDRKEIEDALSLLLKRLNNGILNQETGEYISVPCSVGVVIEYGDTSSTYLSLIKKADEAMYQAKEAGKNCYILL